MKRNYLITIALLAFCSCTSSNIGDNTKSLCNLSMSNEITQKTMLSSLITGSQVVPLAVANNGFVGNINKIIEHDDCFYILSDFKKINKFNKNGECILEIFKQGAGNGEYINIYDFDVSDNQLFVVTRTPKIVVYNAVDGNFIKNIDLAFPCSALKVCADQLLCEAMPKGAAVVVCNMNGEKLHEFGENTNNPSVMSPVPFVSVEQGVVAYTIFDNNNILLINTNKSSCTDTFIVNADNFLTTEIYKTLVDKYGKKNQYGLMDVGDKLDIYYCISAFRKLNDNILVTFYKGMDNFLGISNVKTQDNSVYNVSRIEDDIFNSDINKLIDNMSFCVGSSHLVTYILPHEIQSDRMKLKYAKSIEEGNPILLSFELAL